MTTMINPFGPHRDDPRSSRSRGRPPVVVRIDGDLIIATAAQPAPAGAR